MNMSDGAPLGDEDLGVTYWESRMPILNIRTFTNSQSHG